MIDEKIIEGLREYLKDHYKPLHSFPIAVGAMALIKPVSFRTISDDASRYIKKHRNPENFSHLLDRKRKEKGLTPSELYKRANVDRRQYSRLMGPENRHPSKNTVISFALALRLERQEFDEFLKIAGYALSDAFSGDVCIMYCLDKDIYDIDEVNTLLSTASLEFGKGRVPF